MIGLRKPAPNPATVHTTATTQMGAPSARTTNRGAPAMKNPARYVIRLGNRSPNPAASSAPAAAVGELSIRPER